MQHKISRVKKDSQVDIGSAAKVLIWIESSRGAYGSESSRDSKDSATDRREAARITGTGSPPPAYSSPPGRSEEHTSELQSLMRISYAVFCLKKTKTRY